MRHVTIALPEELSAALAAPGQDLSRAAFGNQATGAIGQPKSWVRGALANNFRRTSDQGITLSGLFSWSAHRRRAQPVVQGSTPVPPRARRRTDSPITPSPSRPDRRAGAATVARVRWIPWRDSLMQHPLRHAGAMVHEPTRVTYHGCQA